MTRLGWCVAAGFFLGCATASPPPTATAQNVQSTSSTAKKDKKAGLICESYKVTGSHLRKQICRTPEQVKRDREQAEKLMREADRARPAEGT